ncbi:MAG: UpxY family transcription antiterminator [Alistipes sp.]|nr:UpxY family transcription antiterminator [Alistipes sp.]
MEELKWYALRIFRNKISQVWAFAEKDGVECYTPIREIEEVRDGVLHIREKRIMPSLVFVRTTTEYITRLRQLTEDSIYPYCEPKTSKPQPIPDAEMELFRYIARTAAREIEFVEYEPNKGDKVRITGGIFAGATGYIRRVHGTKRFVVCIEGVAAIATTYIPRQYIEKIE